MKQPSGQPGCLYANMMGVNTNIDQREGCPLP